MTDLDYLADLPAAHPADHVAIQFEDRRLTYGELETRSTRCAGLLAELGVQPGDRVAWLGRSCDTFFEIFFGAAKARACLAPINSRLAVPEIAFILKDSAANVFFVTPEYFACAETVIADAGRPIRLVAVNGERAGFESYTARRDAAGAPTLAAPRMDDDVLQL
jgi:acyl-CoA synthetase (AMP-forming)/AMP-acid ligase II